VGAQLTEDMFAGSTTLVRPQVLPGNHLIESVILATEFATPKDHTSDSRAFV
jgi:hypothetical protein